MTQTGTNKPSADVTVKDAPSSAEPPWPRTLAFATAFTLIAGFLDSVGYVTLNEFYVSFMSGNSARLGMAIAAGHENLVIRGLIIIGIFVIGAFIGSLLTSLGGNPNKLSIILCAELFCFCATLVLLAITGSEYSLLPLALAMGMQNSVHLAVTGTETGKSFMTGALFGIGHALAQLVRGTGTYHRAVIHALSWCSFIGGLVFGALCLSDFGMMTALAIATGVIAILVATAFLTSGLSHGRQR